MDVCRWYVSSTVDVTLDRDTPVLTWRLPIYCLIQVHSLQQGSTGDHQNDTIARNMDPFILKQQIKTYAYATRECAG